jgi:hypothetical protein
MNNKYIFCPWIQLQPHNNTTIIGEKWAVKEPLLLHQAKTKPQSIGYFKDHHITNIEEQQTIQKLRLFLNIKIHTKVV